jgi:hypothetical protein
MPIGHRGQLSWLGVLAWLSACATASPEIVASHQALSLGDPAAPPGFAALPDIAHGQQSSRIVQGLSLARQVLATPLPSPPDDRHFAILQAWIDERVAPWVSARREGVDETRFQFGLQAAHAEPEESVIARGVVGLLEENTALELSQIPSPTELDTEPEIAEMFRDLVDTQAKPFRHAAVSEYRKCSELGSDGGDDAKRWGDFCRVRFQRLQRDLTPTVHAAAR